MLMLDQQEHAIVADVNLLPFTKRYSNGCVPQNQNRAPYYEDIISGDSGNPVFLVLENDVILLHTFHYGGAGSGPFLTNFAQETQSKMDFLSNKHNRPNEKLKYNDFSSYPKLVREVK